MKEILNNIVELCQHMYQGMHESIEKDFENGGALGLVRNKFVIGFLVVLLIALGIPMFGSSPSNVTFASSAEEQKVPEEVIKRAVMLESMTTLPKEEAVDFGDIKIESVTSVRVDGKDAFSVSYKASLKGDKAGKRKQSGNIVLRQQGKDWLRYLESSNAWLPS